MGPEGKTPYASLHGKNARDKLVESDEQARWYVPKNIRAKLSLRWNLGVYLGMSKASNEKYIGLPNWECGEVPAGRQGR